MTLVLIAALALVQDPSALLAEGTRYLEEWNLRQAERVFRELAARNPEDSRASYYLGVALARQERTGEAIEAFESARRHGTRPNPSVLFELGKALSKLERWREAREVLEQAVALVPNEPSIRLQLGWVYYSNVEGEKARTEFEKVIAAAPSARAFLYLGLAEVALGRVDPAVAALREAIERDSDLLEAPLALGKVLARAGRDEEATNALGRALQIDRGNAEAHFQLGLIALRREELEAASRSFDAAIEADPDHLQAWYNRALLAERLGREGEARAAWTRVEELRARSR
jgi:tetratricopeptide (TPR) repeat protein